MSPGRSREATTMPETPTVPPRTRGHDRRGWLVSAGIVALVVWSYRGTGVDLGRLIGPEGLRQIAVYVGGLFPPDLSWAALRDAGIGAVETFAISLVGSVLAVGIALPLSLLTARTLLYHGVLFEVRPPAPGARALRIGIYAGAKALLNLLRTIPEVLWALIFVFMVGLGPFPGVLALAFHTGGVLGKLFGEVIEDVVSYALYRWEVNIRAAAVLGFVGAGGLGQRIHVTISLFLEHQLLTLILAIYAMVTLVDALSAYLRRRLV
jgi:phosphonate transport system permease protein